ncbi:Ribosomal-protein-alanine acetyltransferase [Candidatus Erwinia haradaeae]|uniref:Ribosomal-protein-alanine acetyltransferase, partial n=1 Tax=Candidatus Erwinia haradaeae TaxID=1922217 RepID=A0A451DJV4_9GAMM|nr:Ribosomal-protein-alanine acetyltransferase [Candidatus Erwinia haradaeae]
MNQISLLYPYHFNAAFLIEQKSHVYPSIKETFFKNQGARYLNFCLMVDGVMAAFAITQLVIDEANLFNIAVDPNFKRRGLGKALLQHLIGQLSKRNIKTL